MIAISTDVDANKLESCGEDVVFAEFKGEVVCLTDLQLASHIAEGLGDCVQPANDVVHDGACVRIFVDGDAAGFGKCLPHTVNIVHEIDEYGWPICWAKGHDIVRPLDCVDALEG